MAKAKRVSVVLRDETYAAVGAFASASGSSMSGVISQFLDESAPALVGLARALEAAKRDRVEGLDLAHERVAAALFQAAQEQLSLIEKRKAVTKRRRVKK